MKKEGLLGRSLDRFTANPASVRNAVWVLIVSTALIVLVGGLIVWVFDNRDFPDYGTALWYALQTVTTVGYGDKVPTTIIGRLVGAVVMIVGVALIAIITAAITSTFVEAAQRARRADQDARDRDSAEALRRQLDEVITRLTAIEDTLKTVERGPDMAAPLEDRS